MDTQLFEFINKFAGRWALLDNTAIFFARYAGYFLIGVLFVLLVVNRDKWYKWLKIFLGVLAAGFFSRFVITEFVRFLYDRPRPFEVLDVTQLVPHSPDEASFPSGHAAFYFALSWFIFFQNKKLGTAFLVVTFLMGLARVFSGIHYPFDILAGFVVGLLSAVGVYYISQKYIFKNRKL